MTRAENVPLKVGSHVREKLNSFIYPLPIKRVRKMSYIAKNTSANGNAKLYPIDQQKTR